MHDLQSATDAKARAILVEGLLCLVLFAAIITAVVGFFR